MEAVIRHENRKDASSRSQTVCEDTQEAKFEEMFNLFSDGKITYDELLEDYPDHDASLFRKILRRIMKFIN